MTERKGKRRAWSSFLGLLPLWFLAVGFLWFWFSSGLSLGPGKGGFLLLFFLLAVIVGLPLFFLRKQADD